MTVAATVDGMGIGWPSSRSPSRWNSIALRISSRASASVSPRATTPGRSGDHVPYPRGSSRPPLCGSAPGPVTVLGFVGAAGYRPIVGKKANPKKNKAARRRRPAGAPGIRRARLEIDDIFHVMSGATPSALPLVAVASVWLWNLAQDGVAAAYCVDGCVVLHYALAEYGIASRVEAVGIRLERGGSHSSYGQDPRYNEDGTFNGHTVLVVTGAGRFLDPTIGQFAEVPSSRQGMQPLQARLPEPDGLGERPFGIDRMDHVVVYEPLPHNQRQAWRASPAVTARTGEYREAGGNLAANVVAMLLIPEILDRARQVPYPRLRTLLAALEGTKPVGDSRGFRFIDPATGREIWLADVP